MEIVLEFFIRCTSPMGRNRKGKKRAQEAVVEVLGVLVDPRFAFVYLAPPSTTYNDLKLYAAEHIKKLHTELLVEGQEPPIPSEFEDPDSNNDIPLDQMIQPSPPKRVTIVLGFKNWPFPHESAHHPTNLELSKKMAELSIDEVESESEDEEETQHDDHEKGRRVVRASNTTLEALNERLVEMNTRLEASNTRLEESNARLKDSNAILAASNLEFKSGLARVQQSNLEFKSDLAKVQRSNARLEESNTRLEESNARLVVSNSDFKSELAKVQKSNASLVASNLEFKSDLAKVQKSNAELETELAKVQASNLRLGSSNDQLKSELNTVRQLVTENNKVLGHLRRRMILDDARTKIVQDLKLRWDDVSVNTEPRLKEVTELVFHRLSHHLPKPLPMDVIKPIFDASMGSLRFKGNMAAHESPRDKIADSVHASELTNREREILKEIYLYAYGEEAPF
ncbi:hypothetical protein H0H93_006966 [Arthromyces matolae]|nr:hypothetical protein H0H93_006966 [Arthromyces matolae]